MTEMLRYNSGKTPLSLIPASFTKTIVDYAVNRGLPVPTRLIWQVGAVLDFGAKKYTAHNWRRGGSWTSCLNSALRHLVKMIEGSTIDDESGMTETGHLGCNLAFLLEFQLRDSGEDDRFKLPKGDLALNSFELRESHPLYDVWNYLLAWQEGGSVERLKDAIVALALYVESDGTPPLTNRNPVPPTDPESDQLKLEYIEDGEIKLKVIEVKADTIKGDFIRMHPATKHIGPVFEDKPRKPFISRLFAGIAA